MHTSWHIACIILRIKHLPVPMSQEESELSKPSVEIFELQKLPQKKYFTVSVALCIWNSKPDEQSPIFWVCMGIAIYLHTCNLDLTIWTLFGVYCHCCAVLCKFLPTRRLHCTILIPAHWHQLARERIGVTVGELSSQCCGRMCVRWWTAWADKPGHCTEWVSQPQAEECVSALVALMEALHASLLTGIPGLL